MATVDWNMMEQLLHEHPGRLTDLVTTPADFTRQFMTFPEKKLPEKNHGSVRADATKIRGRRADSFVIDELASDTALHIGGPDAGMTLNKRGDVTFSRRFIVEPNGKDASDDTGFDCYDTDTAGIF